MTDHRNAQTIAALLQRSRLRSSTEGALQRSIADVLGNAGIEFERERSLGPADRPDFLCGDVAIEAKCKYPRRAIYAQVERYASHDTVAAVVLVTGTPLGMPAQIHGKPIYVVSLGMGSLGC